MEEQPDSGSPASVEDRIGALFDEQDAPATPEVAVADAESDTEQDSETDAEDGDGAQPSAELIEVQDDDGNTYQVPAKLKDAFERRQDYTRKTQHTATLTKAAEDRLHFAEAKEQVLGAIAQDFASLHEKQARLAQLNGLDLGALYNADPGQVFSIQKQIRELEREIGEGQRTVQGKAQHIQQAMQQHRERQWALAVEGAKQALGAIPQEDDVAMHVQVRKLGFEESELKGRFADARFLQLVHKAAKWDALQSNKSAALKSVSGAAPVLKPGTTGQGQQFAERMQFRKAMKAARSDAQKAVLIGDRLANKFKF